MIKHRWLGTITVLLMAAALLLLGVGFFMPSAFDAVADTAPPPYAVVMDKTAILDIQIIADERDWASMLENATAEEYIPATVVINGVKLENVGIRPKGNSSLSTVARDNTTDRYSFKIEFDRYVKGQTWLGLDKIVLNNMQGDATYMKEYLSYDIMEYAGVDVPLYTFSNISVNGEAWGFYLAVEALEDSYAKRVYGNDHGKLYKPESMGVRGNGQMNEFIEGFAAGDGDMEFTAPERIPMDAGAGGERGAFGGGGFGGQSGAASLQYIGDEISSYSVIFDNAVFDSTDLDYTRVINALKRLSSDASPESAVDVEATLKYFAAHTVIVNLDSYVSSMCHNYYLYEKDGILTMLPWDFNLAFGGFQSGSASSVVNFPIDTPVSGVSLEDRPILAKLLAVPEYLELYHSYLQDIVQGYFNSGMFENTINSLDALIAGHVEADPSAFYDLAAYQSGTAELKKLGLLRARSIEGQLGGSIPSTTEGQSANPSALVDASSINLSALGNMGGGFGGRQDDMGGGIQFGNRGENVGGMPGGGMAFDREAMQKAMEIIQSAGGGELSEEQMNELLALGITEEQIEMFRSINQGSIVGAARPGNSQGGMPQQGGIPGDMNNALSQRVQTPTGMTPSTASSFGSEAWATLGICSALLLCGLLFVLFFKRRRSA